MPEPTGGRIFLLDNYDSFTYNLYQLLADLGADVIVRRNDQVTVPEIEAMLPDLTGIVLSPGPCTPREAGVTVPLIRELAGKTPILGVCLGHQLIAQLHGGRVGNAPDLVHGMAGDVVRIAPDPLLDTLPERFSAGRYHSLAAHEPLPEMLIATARSDDGTVMALRHATEAIHGVQFHPESVLTPDGPAMMRAFLEIEEVG